MKIITPRIYNALNIIGLCVAAILLLQTNFAHADESVNGTVTYRERIALPHGAIVIAQLRDISLADAPSELIGETRFKAVGGPPFNFQIAYDASKIDRNRVYSVSARIVHNDRLLFVSDRIHPAFAREHTGGQSGEHNLVLVRSHGVKPPNEPSRAQMMIGELVYFADAATFRRCGTATTVPVAQQGDYLTLERSYLAAQTEPQEAILVTLQGKRALLTNADGRKQVHLIVKRFMNSWPRAACAPVAVDIELENSRWKLDYFDGNVIKPNARAPDAGASLGNAPLIKPKGAFISFDARSSQFGATAGCNRIFGSYKLSGKRLSFKAVGSTMMACTGELFKHERALLAVLDASYSSKIVGTTMTLHDRAGAMLAQLSVAPER